MLRGLANRIEQQLWARRAYKTVLRRWTALPDLQSCIDSLAALHAAREIAPIEMAFPTGRRILVIAPHPDDEMIGPGGTLLGALDNGSTVRVLYLTSGGRDAETMVRREAEAEAAGKACGYDTHFLHLTDFAESLTDEAIESAAAAIAEFNPELLFVSFFADDHPEHRRASELLTVSHDRGLLPGRIEIWAYQVYTAVIANVIVDVTATRQRKAAAIQLFHSQMQRRDWAHFAAGLTAYNSRFLPGKAARHAEMFHVAPLTDYADLCRPYFNAA